MHFCTYFDIRYLPRGLALYRSLERQGEAFTLWILCFDEPTYDILSRLRLPQARLIRQQEFEAGDAALQMAKGNRSLVEYYWTCTPSLPLYILAREPSVRVINYLDADMFFFGAPEAILRELGENSILIVPHDYASEYTCREYAGKFNVGILSFRADEIGLRCLRRWREQCIEWCYTRAEQGKWGDQGYLNAWPAAYDRLIIAPAVGLRLAPWNIGKYPVSVAATGQVLAGGQPLTCFHFHALHFCWRRLAFLAGWPVPLDRQAHQHVFGPYLQALQQAEAESGVKLVRTGLPLRYVAGRILKRQPVRNFAWARRPSDFAGNGARL